MRLKTIITIEKNDYTGKISSKIKALAIKFARFFLKKIAKLFSNCFKPINLYKLCWMRSQKNFVVIKSISIKAF